MSTSGVLARIRAAHPLVHCISNIVTANDCANLALAVGASPMMAQAPEEMEEIAALAGAVVLNTGTPDAAKFRAARLAGAAANAGAFRWYWTRWAWGPAAGGWETSMRCYRRSAPTSCG